MTVTIYHNPNCGTSRNTLRILEAAGETPRVVAYIDTPPGREEIAALIASAGLTPREALRVKGNEDLLRTLGLAEPLDDGAADDTALLEAMAKHPILLNRPFVVTERGTVLARPSERVTAILTDPPASFVKEDGETVDLTADGGRVA